MGFTENIYVSSGIVIAVVGGGVAVVVVTDDGKTQRF